MSKTTRDRRIDKYLAFAAERPELFGPTAGAGIRILLDRGDIERVEDAMTRELRARGLPETGAQVGVVDEDPYFWFVRDAVEFPDGGRRTYARVISRSGFGAAVLPLLAGCVVLTRQFRHGVRRWSLEIPRGSTEPGHTPEDTARAEVREEVGGEIAELVPLGFVHGTTNLYSGGAYLFLARLTSVGAPQLAEAITSVEQVSVPDFERLLRAGEIVDSVTIAAFTHARLRGLI
jgi:ADP-ribose pyrophosphatase